MLKDCPKCKHSMVKISPDNVLDEERVCLNPDCKYRESIHQIDKIRKEAEQKQK